MKPEAKLLCVILIAYEIRLYRKLIRLHDIRVVLNESVLKLKLRTEKPNDKYAYSSARQEQLQRLYRLNFVEYFNKSYVSKRIIKLYAY